MTNSKLWLFCLKKQEHVADYLAVNGTGKGRLPQDLKQLSSGKVGGVQGLLQPADMLLREEHECISPDDISLPPLPGSPDSPLILSDMEVEEHASPSLSLHISSYRMQMGASHPGEAQECGLPPPAAFADTCDDKRELYHALEERPGPVTHGAAGCGRQARRLTRPRKTRSSRVRSAPPDAAGGGALQHAATSRA